MIERKSIIDTLEVPVGGGVGVRIALLLVEDGVTLSSKWHRTFIPAGTSPAEQLAYVNSHLAEMGETKLSSADIQRVGLFHKLAGDLPSEHAVAKTIDEQVTEIQAAKASTEVKAS